MIVSKNHFDKLLKKEEIQDHLSLNNLGEYSRTVILNGNPVGLVYPEGREVSYLYEYSEFFNYRIPRLYKLDTLGIHLRDAETLCTTAFWVSAVASIGGGKYNFYRLSTMTGDFVEKMDTISSVEGVVKLHVEKLRGYINECVLFNRLEPVKLQVVNF